MNTAQVFADYLGLTPASAPWAYEKRRTYTCPCRTVSNSGNHSRGGDPVCGKCGEVYFKDWRYTYTATSPLEPAPNPAWLYELVICKRIQWIDPQGEGFFAAALDENNKARTAIESNPIHACARALIAADPALRARLEACEDWKEYNQ